MKNKVKSYVLLPVILIVYTVVMAIVSLPRYRRSGNWGEYVLIIAISLIASVILYFVLKKKHKIRDNFK
ncbi:DUF3309 family protein [Anaerorudis cellulosivorans]|uniref:DUF3309 family protein n=1 Tax=Anaerorudis cellulosivorans TaxID=3397862 RepID=UPI00221F8465|nr:hypothetical protein [Seramator thermalis]MCW1734923.1 hypothetical protein [Seramator thermalis]